MLGECQSPAMPNPFANPLSRLREWGGPLVEAANRPGPYPNWLMVGIKATVTVGLLTLAATWSMDRSAKMQLGQLAQDAAKGGSTKASRQR